MHSHSYSSIKGVFYNRKTTPNHSHNTTKTLILYIKGETMAGVAYGISVLAVGAGEAPRRPTQAQSHASSNSDDHNNPTPTEEFGYVNSARQNVKGLTNQTGYVKGNANGAINFGTLKTFARQA
ncbi:hypothetical protein PHAVU_003G112900 [Phaseolus vulgaris]|uniref:Uncharacterized protein n=1 Tax=Phaseolus vulgaris TaxID=3885 RepID=V7C8A1_PHAVU|nr:hypothetical protein PHAVU_003G112900g [Phaseolus vulgaris]ESW26359.1 hypothetical protein PHAVU_003G112900g [Phaseolus vulgaris]